MSDQRCPEKSELSAFVRSQLPDERAEEIAEHLARCADCEDTVANYETRLDRLIRPLSADLLQHDAQARADPDHDNKDTLDRAADSRQRLRDYELLEKLGEGGMGIVYKARHTRLQRVVALKVLPTRHFDNAEAVTRFQREMSIVGGLDHPHIARASDAGEENGTHYLVMDLIDGKNLSELISQQSQLRVCDACEIACQVAIGLQYAHEHGLVHRDIKPSNLILSPNSERESTGKPTLGGTVKILDFGLALLINAQQPSRGELTQVGQLMGTLEYMAPEQTENARRVDIRADIYALGSTIYRLITGRAPFATRADETPLEKLHAIATKEPTPITDIRPDVPSELAAVVHRMLAKRPEDRYSTPAEVAQALLPFTDGANLASLLQSPAGSASAGTVVSEGQASKTLRHRDAGMVAQHRTCNSSGGRRSIVWAAAALLLAIGLGGVLYRVSTNYGTLIIEIDDAAVQALLKQEGVIIRDTQANRQWTITGASETLPPGRYAAAGDNIRFRVTDDAGLEVETDEFTLRRGHHTRIRIILIPPPTAHVVEKSYTMLGEWKPGPSARWPGLATHPTRFDAFKRWQVYLATPRVNVLVQISPEGDMVAIPDRDGLIRIYRFEDKRLEPSCFLPCGLSVLDLCWSPDGKQVVSVDSKTLRWWNVPTRTPGLVVDFVHSPYAVAWCPERNIIGVGTSQGQISFFTSDGQDITTFPAHDQAVLSLDWSRQGTLASIGEDGNLAFWDHTGAKVWSTEVGKRARQVVWSSDGTHIAVRYDGWENDLALRVYDVENRHMVGRLQHWAPFRDIAWISEDQVIGCHDNGHLAIWRIGQPELDVSYPITTPGDLVHLSVATNGKVIVLDTQTRGPLLFDLQSHRVHSPLPPIPAPLTSLAVNPSGDRIATSRQDGKVLIWDLSSRSFRTDTILDQNSALDLAWQTDDVLACAGDGGTQLYEVSSGAPLKTLRALGSPIAWDNSSKYLTARATDGRLAVWDSHSEEIITIANANEWLHTAWSPIRPVLATSLTSGTVVMHDMQDGSRTELAVMAREGLAWTPDGTRLIAAERPDGDISAWDLPSGKKRWVVPGADGLIAAHPEGKFLVSLTHREGILINIADGSRIGGFPTSGYEKTGTWISDGNLFVFHDDVSLHASDGSSLTPLWRAFPFADEEALVLTAAGQRIAGDAELVDQHLLYVAEERDGRLSIFRHADFLRKVGRENNRAND